MTSTIHESTLWTCPPLRRSMSNLWSHAVTMVPSIFLWAHGLTQVSTQLNKAIFYLTNFPYSPEHYPWFIQSVTMWQHQIAFHPRRAFPGHGQRHILRFCSYVHNALCTSNILFPTSKSRHTSIFSHLFQVYAVHYFTSWRNRFHIISLYCSCFLALLIIAAILWKIKQKYELYRRRQVRIVYNH